MCISDFKRFIVVDFLLIVMVADIMIVGLAIVFGDLL